MTLATAALDRHLGAAASAMLKGDVVPVLGAGANLCDRENQGWTRGLDLPSGPELARWLARTLDCKVDNADDLLRVAQYADVTLGDGPLYKELRAVFNNDDFRIPSIHTLLAQLPKRMESAGLPKRPQLIVTTNYDNLLERALRAAGEPFDVVRYLATGEAKGHFVHEPSQDPDESTGANGAEPTEQTAAASPESSEHTIAITEPAGAHEQRDGRRHKSELITDPKRCLSISPEHRTVVLKIHGGLDRDDPEQDSYVICEDDYIDFLSHTSPSNLIPAKLLESLVNSHLLFLGYALRDWNLRVVLHSIWSRRARSWKSWAVQREVDAFDEELWDRRGVEIFDLSLATYVSQLSTSLDAAIERMINDEASGRSDGPTQ